MARVFGIKIGGSLGKGLDKVGDAVVGTGHAIGNVASNPYVQGALAAGLAATGVGAPAAAGLLAATRGGGALLKPGGNLGKGLKGGAEGAALGLGAAKAGQLVRGGIGAAKAGGLGSLIRGGGADNKGNFGLAGDIGGRLPGGAGGLGGALGLGQKGGPSLLDLGLGGLSAYNAAQLGQKSEDYATKASDLAHKNYDERGGLRAAGVAGMLNPQPSAFGAQAINNLGAVSGANPFARPALRMAPPPPGGGSPLPNQPAGPLPGSTGAYSDVLKKMSGLIGNQPAGPLPGSSGAYSGVLKRMSGLI